MDGEREQSKWTVLQLGRFEGRLGITAEERRIDDIIYLADKYSNYGSRVLESLLRNMLILIMLTSVQCRHH